MKPEPLKNKISGKELHNLYLFATRKLNPINYNSNAQKSFEELNKEQQKIDKIISLHIKIRIKSAVEWYKNKSYHVIYEDENHWDDELKELWNYFKTEYSEDIDQFNTFLLNKAFEDVTKNNGTNK